MTPAAYAIKDANRENHTRFYYGHGGKGNDKAVTLLAKQHKAYRHPSGHFSVPNENLEAFYTAAKLAGLRVGKNFKINPTFPARSDWQKTVDSLDFSFKG